MDNVDGKANNNIEELVIDSEADKFLILFEKIFNEKHIEQENITQNLDAEDGAIQDILIKIANKISEKIENSTGENKTLKLLKLISFLFKSFSTNGKDKSLLGDDPTIISITEDLLLQKKLPMLENVEEIMNVDLKSNFCCHNVKTLK